MSFMCSLYKHDGILSCPTMFRFPWHLCSPSSLDPSSTTEVVGTGPGGVKDLESKEKTFDLSDMGELSNITLSLYLRKT